jgi:hypothetical protein
MITMIISARTTAAAISCGGRRSLPHLSTAFRAASELATRACTHKRVHRLNIRDDVKRPTALEESMERPIALPC